MVQVRLSTIMGERRLKQTDIQRGTGLTHRTVWKYYHSYLTSVDLRVIGKLCDYLNVEPGDLLVRTAD